MTTPKTTSTPTSQTPQIPKELQDAASKAAGAAIDNVKQTVTNAINPANYAKNAAATADRFITNIPVAGWIARMVPEEQRLTMINSAVLPVWKMVEPVVTSITAMIPQGVKDMLGIEKKDTATPTPSSQTDAPTTPAKTAPTNTTISPSVSPVVPKAKEKDITR